MPYTPLSLEDLAQLIAAADGDEATIWRYVAEFLEDAKWETPDVRRLLVAAEPKLTGNERWDTFLGALGEHVTYLDGQAAPLWCQKRKLAQFWFPFDSLAARVDAFVHSPVSFRRRGIFIAPQELAIA